MSICDVDLPQPLLVAAAREAIAKNDPDAAHSIALEIKKSLLGPAINATGVLLHTNLGRAPLTSQQINPFQPSGAGQPGASEPEVSQPATGQPAASQPTPARASNLELDMATGKRGSRHVHAARLLAQLAGAEAALVVNNCAAAVMLVLAALANGRSVAVSRGELVEIGGGFRVPDVMTQSGAKLVEVGTTNRTRAADYVAAASDANLALLLKVHPSNYRISGFTETTDVAELAQIGPPVVVDLGSGLIDERCDWIGVRPDWLRNEPGVFQTLAAGADIVTFSGDKLFGGPQAGIICGKADLVAQCAAHPLMRALRPGSMVLAALQQTALSYLKRDGAAIPFWAMATIAQADLEKRARQLAQSVTAAQAAGSPGTAQAAGVAGAAQATGTARSAAQPAGAAKTAKPVVTEALAGAGSLPDQAIPSAGIELPGDITAQLRAHNPPVIARVRDQFTVIDLRTVAPADDAVVAAAITP